MRSREEGRPEGVQRVAAVDLISDDDRSIAANSWSIKSDYGNTLDDDQRQANAEALSAVPYRAASNYSSDKEESDVESSMKWVLGSHRIDYEEAIDLARSLVDHDGFSNIKFLVDDILETKLDQKFELVTDKGTRDAIGLHPDGPLKRIMYWDSISELVASGGILVITSCNSTKEELVQEVEAFNQKRIAASQTPHSTADQDANRDNTFQYIDHIRTYPTFMFGGFVGSRVATVAFLRK
ncbi:hypothetical protein DH2020_022140 [Rehmannia glutinosa]|uniref:Methyltransferase domain-containing protein n=1 Tax=Rehmannia glutinosa TaxID=99300 RepID=A0ABR0WGR5_REHGL